MLPVGHPRGHRSALAVSLRSAVILCHSRRAAVRVLASVTRYLSQGLRLIVNEAKSKVVPLAQASFLGFQILRRKIRWTDKSRKKLKVRIRELTSRTRGVSPSKVIVELQTYLRGAINYYAYGIPYGEVRELDGWLRRRMRLYYWKQWGRPRTRRRKLISLGIDREEVHKASRSRKGHWRMSQNSLVRWAMSDAWLFEQGVPNLTDLPPGKERIALVYKRLSHHKFQFVGRKIKILDQYIS